MNAWDSWTRSSTHVFVSDLVRELKNSDCNSGTSKCSTDFNSWWIVVFINYDIIYIRLTDGYVDKNQINKFDQMILVEI